MVQSHTVNGNCAELGTLMALCRGIHPLGGWGHCHISTALGSVEAKTIYLPRQATVSPRPYWGLHMAPFSSQYTAQNCSYSNV